MPAWIIYEREGGRESFFGLWVSKEWSDNAIDKPDALFTDKIIDIDGEGIDFINDGLMTFKW